MKPKTRSNSSNKNCDTWDHSSRRSNHTEFSETEQSEEDEDMDTEDEVSDAKLSETTPRSLRPRRNSSATETKTPTNKNGTLNPRSSGRYSTRFRQRITNMSSLVPGNDSDSRETFVSTSVVREKSYNRTKPDLGSDDDANDFEESGDMYTRVKNRHAKKTISIKREGSERVEQEPIATRLRERKRNAESNYNCNRYFDSQRKSDLNYSYMKRKPRKRRSSDTSGFSTSSSDDDSQYRSSQKKQKSGLKAGGTSSIEPVEVDPNTTFQSVGGLDSVITKLREVVMLPLIYKDFYSARGLHAPKGILFYGHPGTGKTLLARALVNECSIIGGRKVTFFVRKGADLLSKYVGESEKQIRNLFEHASRMQPSIIFFDEIDGIAPARSSQTDQTYNSVIATLLAEMDGLKNRGDIIVIGATNRLESVDPAFRRPGRFDFEVQFSLPLELGRIDILVKHTSLWKQQIPDEVIAALAKKTNGFSGADLQLLCAEASLIALRRQYPQIYSSTNKFKLDYDSVMVGLNDWIEALDKIRPSSNRSVFTSSMQPMPLPEAVAPLLQKQVNEVYEVIKQQHPIIDYPSLLREPAPKRIMISSNTESDGLNDFVLPAIVHMLGIQQTFLLRPEGLMHSEVLPDSLAINQVFDQAEQTGKLSVVILPEIDKLFQGLSSQAQEVLCRRVKSACMFPLVVIATSRSNLRDFCSESEVCMIEEIFERRHYFTMSKTKARKKFFKNILNSEALMVRLPKEPVPENLEQLELAPPPEPPKLSKSEQKHRDKKDRRTLMKLRMFLREVLSKVKGKRYEQFVNEVDKKEVPDYYKIIEKPMCLQLMSHKLDQGEYLCTQDFMQDIYLIRENAANYNPKEDYEITHKAFALVDHVDMLIEELDSDFEEECVKVADRMRSVKVSNEFRASGSRSSSPTVQTSEALSEKDRNPRPRKQRKVSSDSGELQVSSSTANVEIAPVSMIQPSNSSNFEILDIALLNRTAKPSENWEANCSLLKTISKAAAKQTDGIGIYGLLNLRYNLMTLIYRHWEDEDKASMIENLVIVISQFLASVDEKDEANRSSAFTTEVNKTRETEGIDSVDP